jgi:integrase
VVLGAAGGAARHAGGEDLGGFAVGGFDPGGVDAQGGGASAAVADAAGDGAQVHPGGNLDRSVLPALGALRLREITVARLDGFLNQVRIQRGNATAKICRSVVSGVLGLAVRHGALAGNPVRDVGRIESGRRTAPRALTADERARWRAQLQGDATAVRKDLPDLTRFMIATGVRIGEALAAYRSDVDFDAGTVAINYMLKARFAEDEGSDGRIFPDTCGGLRDPANTRRDLRHARGGEEFGWVTSHVFRKTAATILDQAALSARAVADQLGHSRPSMTQDIYMGRKIANPAAAAALERAFDTRSTHFVGVKSVSDLEQPGQ